MSGIISHSGLTLPDLASHRGLSNLQSIDGLSLVYGGPPAEEVVLSGCGYDPFNTTWPYAGEHNDRPVYRGPGSNVYIYFNGTCWCIDIFAIWPSEVYQSWYAVPGNTDLLPPQTGWATQEHGVSPPPTISY